MKSPNRFSLYLMLLFCVFLHTPKIYSETSQAILIQINNELNPWCFLWRVSSVLSYIVQILVLLLKCDMMFATVSLLFCMEKGLKAASLIFKAELTCVVNPTRCILLSEYWALYIAGQTNNATSALDQGPILLLQTLSAAARCASNVPDHTVGPKRAVPLVLRCVPHRIAAGHAIDIILIKD